MTAPAEDPRGGEAPFILCCDPGADVYPEPCPVHGTDNRRYAIEDLSAEGHGYVGRPAGDREANARRLAWFTEAELAAELNRRRALGGTT